VPRLFIPIVIVCVIFTLYFVYTQRTNCEIVDRTTVLMDESNGGSQEYDGDKSVIRSIKSTFKIEEVARGVCRGLKKPVSP
jgi:hypothetical protein